MFKRGALIATAVLAASTGVAFANGGVYAPAPAAPHHLGSFYIGAGISRDTADFDLSATSARDQVIPFFGTISTTSRKSKDISGTGVNGILFGGYGMTFQDHYYLGAEIFGSISSLSGKTRSTHTATVAGITATTRSNSKLELQHSYGISLLPGFKISDSTMIFGRIGYIRSRFKLSNTTTLTSRPTVSTSVKKSKGGIQLGLGMETMVTNNVSIRGEWDWSRYGKLKASSAFSSVSVRPTIDQFTLSAIYHFV